MVIPEESDQIAYHAKKGSHGGRPRFDAELYRTRNVFERLQPAQGMARRRHLYDEHARSYRTGVVGACIVLFWAPAASGPSDDLDSSETHAGKGVCPLRLARPPTDQSVESEISRKGLVWTAIRQE